MRRFSNRWQFSGRSFRRHQYDKGVVFGTLLCAGLLIAGVFAGQNAAMIINPLSLVIVLGGTFGATMINFTSDDLKRAKEAFFDVLQIKEFDSIERIRLIHRLAVQVRNEGLLVLERAASRSGDRFFKLALELTVDGQNQNEVRRVLENEIASSHMRAARAIQVFETMGNYAPAMGLIGTLIGLIQMLGSLSSPEAVGPAMAVALTTTLYGAVLANILFLPIAGKLRNRIEEETQLKRITVEGVLSLGNQENPIVVQQRLKSFMPAEAHG